MKLSVQVEKHIIAWILMLPIIGIMAYGSFFASTSNEIFIPLFLLSLGLWFLFFFGLIQLYFDITQTRIYEFFIEKNYILIEYYINKVLKNRYEITRKNLDSFETFHHNTHGSIFTTYIFTLKDKQIYTIKENFEKEEKEIMRTLIEYQYYPKNIIDRLKDKI